jgi:NAD+ kinase
MNRPLKPTPITSVAVVAKLGSEDGLRIAAELGAWLREHGVRVRFDADSARTLGRRDGFPRDALPRGTDLAVVAGGDGTLLSVARVAAPRGVPVLGVNFGSLGFLTEIQPDELFAGMEHVLAGEYEIEERQTLRVRVRRGGKVLKEYTLLNDAVVNKGALARMIALEVRVDDDPVATYTSDGLIVATPTGSTAYNLSAGGPILDPRMRAVVITPICPHTMTYRPLVVPASVRAEVALRSASEAVYLTLDGQVGLPLRENDTVVVDEHPNPVRLVRVLGRSFFEVLRRKLRWGAR